MACCSWIYCIRSGSPGREPFGGRLIRPLRGNGRNQVGEEGTLVLLTSRAHGEHALDKAAPALALGAVAPFVPEDGRTQRPLAALLVGSIPSTSTNVQRASQRRISSAHMLLS